MLPDNIYVVEKELNVVMNNKLQIIFVVRVSRAYYDISLAASWEKAVHVIWDGMMYLRVYLHTS